MKVNKKLYRVLSSKGQDKGVVRGFRVPKDFPLKNIEMKLVIANIDTIRSGSEEDDVKFIVLKLDKWLKERRKNMDDND